MDLIQRKQFRDLVVLTMKDKGLSAAALSRSTGIAENTIGRVTNAKVVNQGTVAKICKALEIDPLAQAQAKEGYSVDVELVRDAIGMWLRDTPENQRAAKVLALFKAIANEAGIVPETPVNN